MKPSQSKGIRRRKKTIKCGCPVKIRAIAVKNGDGELIYKITNSNLQHLHFVPQENQTDEVFTVSDQEQIATDCLVKLCYQGDRDKDFVSPPNDMDLDVHVQERTAHSAEIGERLSPLVNSAKASDDSKLLIAQHKRILQNCTAHRKALKSSKQRYESDDDNLPLAIAWAQELSNMDRQQQILAKKAICNIIFEGQMGLLHQN